VLAIEEGRPQLNDNSPIQQRLPVVFGLDHVGLIQVRSFALAINMPKNDKMTFSLSL
jgi:hypothetical protein